MLCPSAYRLQKVRTEHQLFTSTQDEKDADSSRQHIPLRFSLIWCTGPRPFSSLGTPCDTPGFPPSRSGWWSPRPSARPRPCSQDCHRRLRGFLSCTRWSWLSTATSARSTWVPLILGTEKYRSPSDGFIPAVRSYGLWFSRINKFKLDEAVWCKLV